MNDIVSRLVTNEKARAELKERASRSIRPRLGQTIATSFIMSTTERLWSGEYTVGSEVSPDYFGAITRRRDRRAIIKFISLEVLVIGHPEQPDAYKCYMLCWNKDKVFVIVPAYIP